MITLASTCFRHPRSARLRSGITCGLSLTGSRNRRRQCGEEYTSDCSNPAAIPARKSAPSEYANPLSTCIHRCSFTPDARFDFCYDRRYTQSLFVASNGKRRDPTYVARTMSKVKGYAATSANALSMGAIGRAVLTSSVAGFEFRTCVWNSAELSGSMVERRIR